MNTVAALYVQKNGVYFGLDGVDPWDEERNALTYDGPFPVVAHPPCSRWCRLAGLVEKRWGHKKGDDGGTFAHALHCVRTFGGVLEHPGGSDAWGAYRLPVPMKGGGWVQGLCGGWSCEVYQSSYGNRARKQTWLYAYGVELPELVWGEVTVATATVGSTRGSGRGVTPEVTRRERSRTPIAFRDVLLEMARSAG